MLRVRAGALRILGFAITLILFLCGCSEQPSVRTEPFDFEPVAHLRIGPFELTDSAFVRKGETVGGPIVQGRPFFLDIELIQTPSQGDRWVRGMFVMVNPSGQRQFIATQLIDRTRIVPRQVPTPVVYDVPVCGPHLIKIYRQSGRTLDEFGTYTEVGTYEFNIAPASGQAETQ